MGNLGGRDPLDPVKPDGALEIRDCLRVLLLQLLEHPLLKRDFSGIGGLLIGGLQQGLGMPDVGHAILALVARHFENQAAGQLQQGLELFRLAREYLFIESEFVRLYRADP